MKNIVLLCFLAGSVIYSPVLAQRKTKLNTNGQGTLFAQVGINRSAYTQTNVVINGGKYDATLNSVALKDNEEGKGMGDFFSSSSPQINIKLGFFIQPEWAITVGFNRYNTFFKNQQTVGLDGTFAPGSHPEYSGSVNEDLLLTKEDFYVAQRKGMNFISIGIQRNDLLIRTKRAEFAFQSLYGIEVGPLLTQVEYTYDNSTEPGYPSWSGIGAAGYVGLRFEFFQYIYLQAEINGGILYQNNIRLSEDEDRKVEQKVGFFSPSLLLGFNIFANPKNNCGTCPKW